ncbi:transcriptional regulator [gamma proteobacterium NOR5-3]|nr:transcriptional regulator [gamma proteobacterium NOR5-3]
MSPASAGAVPDAAQRGPSRDSTSPLIRTKLHKPPLPSDYVCRDRLLDKMDKAMDVPLTLVSAGAGTGKSVMVAAWLEDRGHPGAWLSLDDSDGDLRRFLRYLVAGLESLHPGSLQDTAALLDAPELPPVAVIAAHFTNELDRSTMPQVLVLDDYHLLDPKSSVHELIRGYLKHPPQSWHLILVSRKDPPLALGSLRGAGKINEIRQQDLPFSIAETAGLLSGSVPSGLGEKQIEAIQLRVEGWAAGLRLVGLACRQAPDIDRFIAQLGGNLPDTTAYLMDEVLTTLPAAFSGYLIKTAVLDRFCPALLDAIHPDAEPATTEMDGTRFVELLNHSNLFVVPLDANCEWFRYHHVFQQLLLDQLKQVCSPNEIHALHSNASTWFEQQGCIDEAIKHAVATDVQAAADIVERHRNEPLRNDRWSELQEWLDMLPASIKMSRPSLLLCHGWLASFRLEIDVMAVILQTLDGLEVDLANPILVAEKNFFSSVVAYWEGRFAESLRFSEAAIAVNPGAADMAAGESHLYRALSLQVTGHTRQALSQLRAELNIAPKGSEPYQTRLVAALSFVHLLNGDLELAHEHGRQTVTVAIRNKLPHPKLWGEFICGVASFCAGRFRQTSDILSHCTDSAYIFDIRAACDAYVGVALCHQFNGDNASAEKLMAEGIAYAEDVKGPEAIAVVASAQARLQLLQGNAKAALRWARRESDEANPVEMLFWIEVPKINKYRVLITAGTKTECEKSLGDVVQLRTQLQALHMKNHIIPVAVLQALGLAKLGRENEARTVLIECLELGGEAEWMQPFVEAGEPLIGMLEGISKTGHHREFIQSVLSAYDQYVAAASRGKGTGVATPHVPDHVGLTDLTNRELDILELLAQRLQNKQIGARLNISTHTVKDHLKHVYQKLEVSNRRDAIAKATRTGLLKDSRPNS